MPKTPHRRSAPSASEMHRQWLELVDTEGPFLAIPPLKRVWPQGMPQLNDGHRQSLAIARKEFEGAWESWDKDSKGAEAEEDYCRARDEWVETVLREFIGWKESLVWGEMSSIQAQSPNRRVTVTADAVLESQTGPAVLVHLVNPVHSLREVPGDLWAATPIDRMEALLRENCVEVGVVTDGRWWSLVCAREGAMVASGVVDSLDWISEPRTRDAFFALLSRAHTVGGKPDERLPVLFEQSVAAAEEITEALGAQVRSAVELLIQSFSESGFEAARRGLPDPLPADTHEIYEAAVTVMMRVVFLLFAEERGLLPSGELFEQGYGISRELDRLITKQTEQSDEALDATSMTWHRLLATSKTLFEGATFENMRMPAYGGSLFDPDRFSFLSAVNEHGTLALTVSDRVMLHVLRSVQEADLKGGERRRISFRDIDVEQIGYIYEGLLGYTSVRVAETFLGLSGTPGVEPEIPLEVAENLADENPDQKELASALREWISSDQPSAKPRTNAAISKGLGADVDPSVQSSLTQAVGGDMELRERVLPWLGIMRLDLRDRPFVVLEGGLMVKETPSRRNSGAHYTPKSLAEEVVLHALEPLCYSPGPHQTADRETWELKSSQQILSLKIADIACGSGAFLVAAARYLAARLVEAWVFEDPDQKGRSDLEIRALRKVVANCLYGADINDMAVEMCKLSLWLVSLDRDLPFSFVDDKVFHGNSLLGVTELDQIRSVHINPTRSMEQTTIFDVDLDEKIQHASDLRRALSSEVVENDPARDARAKARQLAELRGVTTDLHTIADGVLAAGLQQGGEAGPSLDAAYSSLRDIVKKAYSEPMASGHEALETLIQHGLTPTVHTDYLRWAPIHWPVEAPDIFVEREGFDAVVGNPPFLGGKKLSNAFGKNVRNWLVNVIADQRPGNADLAAYFFLRARSLLAQQGTLGLIATNTIAQGDTREVGLDQLVATGFDISRAIRSEPWPSSSATLEFAAVWGSLNGLASDVVRTCDGNEAKRITTLLEPGGRIDGLPKRLHQNKGMAFKGVNINGLGFLMTPSQAAEMLRQDARYHEIVRPYFVGDDLNSQCELEAPRWVVDFVRKPKTEAETYRAPFEWCRENVKPQRLKLKNKERLRENWWWFEAPATALRKAVSELSEVLAIAVVSDTIMPIRISTKILCSQDVVVFPTESFGDQAVLSSSVHQLWAMVYGSTLETRPRYTPSDVSETFPRPETTDRLEDLGRALNEERRDIMARHELGLTSLYNRVNDPRISDSSDADVARMRRLHVEVDEAVLEAYGWSDLPLYHGFHTYRQRERWTVCPEARVEILDRLLEENLNRYAVEKARPASASSGSPQIEGSDEPSLFDG
jgi:hypothetical protein